jgi:uncharacterized surface protein with fasciclin (FAS1) repeats
MRKLHRTTGAAATAAALTTTLLATTLTTSLTLGPAQAGSPAPQRAGNTSLARVLAADGNHFDHQWGDFDILDRAVRTVLREKPDSPVRTLAQGRERLTAFLPTDRAFRALVGSLTGTRPRTEKRAFVRLAALADVDTVETVLLYHVVPGATITRRQALRADGAELATAQGGTVTVRVHGRRVALKDADPDARNPRVDAFNLNKGNRQIGHAIDRVLRPVDL